MTAHEIRTDLGLARSYVLAEGARAATFTPTTKLTDFYVTLYKSHTQAFSKDKWLEILDLLDDLVIYFFEMFVKDGMFRLPPFWKWFSIGSWFVSFIKAFINILKGTGTPPVIIP